MKAVVLGRTTESAEAGLAAARRQLALLAANELVTPEQVAFSSANLRASASFEAEAASADLAVESGPENLAFKRELFGRLDALTAPSTLLTSNISGLSITAIVERCARPERVMTTHFWNPPHLMPLVEL